MAIALSRRLLGPAAFAAGLACAADAPPAPPAQTSLRSPLVWEVRDGTHPRLGPITVAVPSASIVTPVGKEKIQTLVFVSCERSRGRIAVELANAAASDPKGGLMPSRMPKMTCNPRGEGAATEIAASWYVSELGDALARGLVPAELRRCASIEISEELALPRGWGASAQRIDIEVIPYKKELDTVLGTCFEGAYVGAPAPAAPSKPAVVARAAPEPAASGWRNARTAAQGGRTNVRKAPRIDAPVTVQLPPGLPLLVQPTGGEWYRVKQRGGAVFEGYIRGDRLVLE